MTDRLSQLQDAVDELATQFVATFNYINRHHDYTPVSPKDEVRQVKPDRPQEIEPHPRAIFSQNLLELSQDLIIKEQQIEALIHSLPGIDRSEEVQVRRIKELEVELKKAEVRRREAVAEKEKVEERLDEVIVGIRRP